MSQLFSFSHFAALLDGLEPCTALLDEQGTILALNRAWKAMDYPNPFVWKVEEGTSYLSNCESLALSKDGNYAIVALGLTSVLRGKVPRLVFEYPCSCEGARRWYSMSAVCVAGEETPFRIVQHTDITKMMLREKQLHRSEALFKATTENASDLITILDTKGVPLYSSPSHQRILGHGPQMLASRPLVELVPEEDHEHFKAALKEAQKLGLSRVFEFRIRHADGDLRAFEGQVSMVENPVGSQDTVLLISRDITQRRQSEYERAMLEIQLRHGQKMEAIGQLAAGVAHEINTPIQFVSDNMRFLKESFQSLERILDMEQAVLEIQSPGPGLTEALTRLGEARDQEDVEYLSSEVPKAIKESLEGLARVASIVQAMKVFSHPGTEGRVALDLNQAIETTLIVSRNEWKYVAEATTELDASLPKVVCSPGEINQVILNLIVNAAHAIGDVVAGTDQKGLIHISTTHVDDWAEIRVKDTGAGIPVAIRDQIFHPFFTTKAVGKGTGQGLSIAHSVVLRHGGTITFESELGQGACFLLRLPIAGGGEEGAP